MHFGGCSVFCVDTSSDFLLVSSRMKKYTLLLLLSTAPLFAGVSAPAPAPAPCADCEQGITFGLEALYLRAFESEGSYNTGDWDFGGRASLGYQFSDCLFTKVTYFGYKSDVYEDSYNDGPNYHVDSHADLQVSYLDWVVGQHFKPSEKFTLSPYVGLRWGTFEENNYSKTNNKGDTDKYHHSAEFSGLGIVIGVDGTRSLGNNFSIYGTAKTSILFGTTDYHSSTKYNYDRSNTSSSSSDDTLASVTELGLGAQYDFAFSNVAANIRLGAEDQYWAGCASQDSENTGLIGFVLGANFRF